MFDGVGAPKKPGLLVKDFVDENTGDDAPNRFGGLLIAGIADEEEVALCLCVDLEEDGLGAWDLFVHEKHGVPDAVVSEDGIEKSNELPLKEGVAVDVSGVGVSNRLEWLLDVRIFE